jgi:hypothetical protein
LTPACLQAGLAVGSWQLAVGSWQLADLTLQLQIINKALSYTPYAFSLKS